MGRLRALLKKLSEKPELLEAYHQIIQEQIREGVVEDVPAVANGEVIHYIPHHAVIVLEKSTPVRPVYDASAKVGKSGSLNSCIFKGSKWLGNTVGSLVRFRKNEKAVTADIRHAFHQISIAEEDRDAVRFIWVHDVKKPPIGTNLRLLRFTRVAFGIVASPFLLYATIQHHLRNSGNEFADILSREMYADNLLASLPSSIDILRFYESTKAVFDTMSMNMTKWRSNDLLFTERTPKEDQIVEDELSVLGLSWEPSEDVMGLRKPRITHLQDKPPTKRLVLKIMASIFDPLGWIAPFVLTIRLFLRKLWSSKREWEAPLNSEEVQLWEQLKIEIQEIHTIKLNRMYFSRECDNEELTFQIHTFVDASADAVGNVSYLRLVADKPGLALLMAKTRLSPSSKLSIPRLEFYALVLGVRTQDYLVRELHLKKVQRYIWSDSKCVLAWVASNKLLPVAVERHLVEIRKSDIFQYRYVPTALNPADVVSRGALLSDLRSTSWFTGPQWLQKEKNWPLHVDVICNEADNLEIEEEAKTMFIQEQNRINIEPPFSIEIEKFSKLKDLLRRTAYCILALHKCLRKEILDVTTPIDYNAARMIWVRRDQRSNGSQNPEALCRTIHFKDVQLFVDERGIIHCKSRMNNSKLPWTAGEPIILVKGSHLTELIVMDIHERNFHVGTAHTLATLRKNYWLIHGRREVFRIIHNKCLKCRHYDARPYAPPQIAPYPEFRITKTSHPFENTGIDIFGPIDVIVFENGAEKVVKRWVLLFTCLVIRAVHLEVIDRIQTVDVICALKRFTARRGTPALILSDNAKQFILAEKCVQDLWQKFAEDESTNRYFAENSIVWKFTPQYAPWMGGAYERLVQVIKNSFKRTYCEQTISEREFVTTIVEIEGVVNNRPITYVDRELATPLLTPNNFLQVAFPAIPINIQQRQNQRLSTRERILEYWKASEEHLNIFWQIWSDQYLLALRELRAKSSNATKEPKVGDIVLMIDPKYRRGHWLKVIIERLVTSSDGRARAAQIRMASGTRMIRPITKLVPIDCLQDPPSEEELPLPSSLVCDGAETAEQLSEDEGGDEPVVVMGPIGGRV